MKKIGFLIPHYRNEKRVVFFPEDVNSINAEVYIEVGYGRELNHEDLDYEKNGCYVVDRKTIYEKCDYLFSLKGVPIEDYELLKSDHIIIGFIQPTRNGRKFFEEVALKKGVGIIDLDNIAPSFYKNEKVVRLKWIPSNYVYKNSLLAGYAAVMHATASFGIIPNNETKIAILGSGNVSQGALKACNLFQSDVRMFYRKTLNEFYQSINDFDIIVNGIELCKTNDTIISRNQMKQIKVGALIIDGAAVPNGAVSEVKQTNLDVPIYKEHEVYFYCVNNTPSLYCRESSRLLNEVFKSHLFEKFDLIAEIANSNGFRKESIK